MSLSVDAIFSNKEIEGFEGRLDFYHFGPVLLVDAYTTPHKMVRDRRTIARSGDAHVIVDCFPTGDVNGVVGGRPVSIGAGDCLVLDIRGTMRLRIGTTRFIGLIVPRKLLGEPNAAVQTLHGLRIAAETSEAKLVNGLLERFVAEAPRLSPARAAAFGRALVGLVVACLDVVDAQTDGRTTEALGPDPASIRRYIERSASDPDLDVRRLSEAFGLSRTSLYRIFRPEGGRRGGHPLTARGHRPTPAGRAGGCTVIDRRRSTRERL